MAPVLTRDLVAALLKRHPPDFVPSAVQDLLNAHELGTGVKHEFAELSEKQQVQRILSNEQHKATSDRLKAKGDTRTNNLMLACAMPHASDWLHAPPIPALGLNIPSSAFRTAMKFRLGLPLYDGPFPCPATSRDHEPCGDTMDVYGDHALCCHNGTSRVFRHNNVRDILGHSARSAGLSSVVIEQKNQIAGSKKKPGDITVQQYHRGFHSSAFDVTVAHPLQKKYIDIAMSEAGVAECPPPCNPPELFVACREPPVILSLWLGNLLVAPPSPCTPRSAAGPTWRLLVVATLCNDPPRRFIPRSRATTTSGFGGTRPTPELACPRAL